MSEKEIEETKLLAVPYDHPQANLVFEGGKIRRTVLPSGVRILTETMPSTMAASIGMWIPRGSRAETPQGQGATHFLEHLLFKGTSTRSAKDIAIAFDRTGGYSNAATAKEHTHYYARVLGKDLPVAVKVLLDMVICPNLDEKDFEMERGVILEEVIMGLDDPSDLVHDAFSAMLFHGHPLGRPVAGTIKTVSDLKLEDLHEHYSQGYTPDQLIIAAAGDLDHDELCDMVQKEMSLLRSKWDMWDSKNNVPRDLLGNTVERLQGQESISIPDSFFLEKNIDELGRNIIAEQEKTAVCDTSEPDEKTSIKTELKQGQNGAYLHRKIKKPFEQTHILLGGRSFKADSENRHVATVAECILGGGMSSRLFQNIREKRGLAYSTYAFTIAYSDTGQFGVSAACSAENAEEVSSLIRAELMELANNSPTEEEMDQVRGQLRGSIALGAENCSSRMARLGRSEIVLGKYVPLELNLQRISSVTAKQVSEYVGEYLAQLPVEVWLGNV